MPVALYTCQTGGKTNTSTYSIPVRNASASFSTSDRIEACQFGRMSQWLRIKAGIHAIQYLNSKQDHSLAIHQSSSCCNNTFLGVNSISVAKIRPVLVCLLEKIFRPGRTVPPTATDLKMNEKLGWVLMNGSRNYTELQPAA